MTDKPALTRIAVTIAVALGFVPGSSPAAADFVIFAGLPLYDESGRVLEGTNPDDPMWDGFPGDLVQIISTGPDGTADPIAPGGAVTGDDYVCVATAIGAGMAWGGEKTGRFVYEVGDPVDGGKGGLYVRVYNRSDARLATYYGESEVFPCSLSLVEDFDVSDWELAGTDRALPDPLGAPFLVIAHDDYDGDGLSDPAVYRPGNGEWDIAGVCSSLVWGGELGDIPATGDYDGDGVAEPAFYREGGWRVWGFEEEVAWGGEGEFPVPADYNGDSVTDFATWSPEEGVWRILCFAGREHRREAGPETVWEVELGEEGDIPVPGDYTGEGRARPAVWRPSTGEWIVEGLPTVKWGGPDDIPVPLDGDGDGALDRTVWRPRGEKSGLWLVCGFSRVEWGVEAAGDVPLTGDYDGTGADDLAIWRPGRGRVFIRFLCGGRTVQELGQEGDIPAVRRCHY
ncbi:MAG TPA: hypothetical protein PLZ73_12590 [bacterium]|nr:hypothetical protein [bacterium]